MKILQINSHFNVGGAARIAGYIHNQLEQDGIEVKTLYGRGEESDNSNIIKVSSNYVVYLDALRTRIFGKVGWYSKASTKRIVKIIEEWKPDVIHLHNIHGYYLNIPMLFECIKKNDISVVWTLHDCFSFTGKCGYHFDCDKWKTGCGDCPYLKGYPKVQSVDKTSWMWSQKKDMFTALNNVTVVTPSDWLTREARESFLGKYNCVTIHNGIDTDVFYPRDIKASREKYGLNENDKIVLGIAIGYSDPRKGAQYIVELARSLDSTAKVVLVGWESKNDTMIEGLNNVVTVPTIKDTNVLAEYYSLADVFVIPSLAENYATTTIEAMACGTPVVGFAIGGIPEQITGGKGECVEVNQESFNLAVKKVLDNRDKYLSREELWESTKEINSINNMVDEYIKQYERR